MLPLNFSPLTISTVRSTRHPLFRAAYDRLWEEFGAANEMESEEVLNRRFEWYPCTRVGGAALRYEMAVVTRGRELIAVRDHVAIVRPLSQGGGHAATVHMSHVVVEPEWRRTGVSAWLRAVPLQTGRAALKAAGVSPDSPITLVAEMEHPTSVEDMRTIRLLAYEKAGFLKVDPNRLDYHQPDFRPPALIDATGGPRPVPFTLIVRRVGREAQGSLSPEECRGLIASLYEMYQTGCRPQDMSTLWSAQIGRAHV